MRYLLAVGLAACVVPEAGDRARMDGGTCPAGETCSGDTPNGLSFLGGTFADELGRGGPHTMAVGGTQTVEVVTDLPFDATSGGASLSVLAVAPPEVVVQGLAPGSDYLRIVEQGTDDLYDRISVSTRAVKSVALRPPLALFYDGELWENPARGVALAVGGQAELVVQLYDEPGGVGERLYDESLAVSSQSLALAGVSATGPWDLILVDGYTAGTATIRLVTGDGTARDLPMRIVDDIDDVECMGPLGAEPDCQLPLQLGSSSTRCFRARSGAEVVLGATWGYAVSSGLTVDQADNPVAGCVTVVGAEVGTATLIASAGNFSRGFTFQVVAASATRDAPPPIGDATPLPARGERAGGRR